MEERYADLEPAKRDMFMKNDGLIAEGLKYTTRYELPNLIDHECKKGSRVWCVLTLMRNGADPNHQS